MLAADIICLFRQESLEYHFGIDRKQYLLLLLLQLLQLFLTFFLDCFYNRAFVNFVTNAY